MEFLWVCFGLLKDNWLKVYNNIERLWLSRERCWDSWPLEERNSIQGQWQALIAQSFSVIKFY